MERRARVGENVLGEEESIDTKERKGRMGEGTRL